MSLELFVFLGQNPLLLVDNIIKFLQCLQMILLDIFNSIHVFECATDQHILTLLDHQLFCRQILESLHFTIVGLLYDFLHVATRLLILSLHEQPEFVGASSTNNISLAHATDNFINGKVRTSVKDHRD